MNIVVIFYKFVFIIIGYGLGFMIWYGVWIIDVL